MMKYRVLCRPDGEHYVAWLMGSRWVRVHDAGTRAAARQYIIARLVEFQE